MTVKITAADFLKAQAEQKANKKNKYGAEKITIDGITFDSKKEARRWQALLLLQRAGRICDLQRQVPLYLEGRDGPVLTENGNQRLLRVDFVYFDLALGITVYEDAKGTETPESSLKRDVLRAQGREVVLV